jgi:hypothetical protein
VWRTMGSQRSSGGRTRRVVGQLRVLTGDLPSAEDLAQEALTCAMAPPRELPHWRRMPPLAQHAAADRLRLSVLPSSSRHGRLAGLDSGGVERARGRRWGRPAPSSSPSWRPWPRSGKSGRQARSVRSRRNRTEPSTWSRVPQRYRSSILSSATSEPPQRMRSSLGGVLAKDADSDSQWA